ncbi:MAG: Mur ligase family protein [bacterium]|nr:Mur ligase family protein [bacterium]
MKIFCIGIGGIGLSGVAQILKAQGNEVMGSDSSPSEITQILEEGGISVLREHNEHSIDSSVDLIIYSEAVSEDNPERKKGMELGIREISYAEALGMISHDKRTIAVTGTHGKTTVTGMLTSILLEAQMDPSIIIGSKIDKLGDRNFRVGNCDLFLAEACEYRGNFLHLSPDIVLINNLEPDHLDYFLNAENYYKVFQQFIEKIPEKGYLIIHHRDESKLDLDKVRGKVIRLFDDLGNDSFQLKVPGKHNQMNALSAQAVSRVLQISDEVIKKGLEGFHGTWRRFEYKGELNGAKLYDDYGHHPTEVQATIQGARELYPGKKLIVIFQPHQYSRTRQLFDEFSRSFTNSNEVWITDIYKARDSDEDIASVSAEQLVQAISKYQSARYVPFSQLSSGMKTHAEANHIFLVMGAGSIHEVFKDLKFLDARPQYRP